MKGRFIFVSLVVVFSLAPAAVERARAQEYTLERCIEIALDVSPAVGISRENLVAARTGVLRSTGNMLPNAAVSFRVGRSFAGPTSGVVFDQQGRLIQPSGFEYDTYVLSISGGMMLFDWGVNKQTLDESYHSAEASRYALEYQKDYVKAVVIREYYDLVRGVKLREVQEEDVEANRRNLEQVEAFYKIGSRTKADFLQARVTMANSELSLINARNAEELARARLLSRLNMPLDSDLALDESLGIAETALDLDQEIEHMMSHRSDLLGRREQVKASENALSAYRFSRLPNLTGYYGYGWNNRSWQDFESMFKTDYSFSLGLALNWDLFDRFLTKSSIANAEASARIADFNLEQAEIDAVLELKQIDLNLKQARERIALGEETVTHARENQRLAEERYRVGAGTILETIEASASLTAALGSLVDAKIDYLINRADMQRATGRQISTK